MALAGMETREFEKLVANALEHLWDFAYLGKHPLANLRSVQSRALHRNGLSYLDTGRALSDVLQAAIESLKLCTQQEELSRERHYYTILHQAYVECVQNKMIARSLDMGERTLYRYSTKAIQAVAQILHDWERQV